MPNQTNPSSRLKEIFIDLLIGVISLIIVLFFYRHQDFSAETDPTFLSEKNYRQIVVENIASKFFKELSKPTKENFTKWRLNDFKVVGYHSILEKSIAGKIKVFPDHLVMENYLIYIPLCVEGTDLKGNKIKQIRTLLVNVQYSKSKVTRYYFVDERPVRFWDRIKFWLKMTFLYPALIFIILAIYFFGTTQIFQGSIYIAWRGTRFIGSLNSVYTSYIAWNSVLMALAGTIIYVGIYLLLILLMKKKFDLEV